MQTNLSTFTMHQNIRLGEKQSKIILALNKVSKSVTSSGIQLWGALRKVVKGSIVRSLSNFHL